MPKGFISLGCEGNWLNVDFINQDKCFYDKQLKKVAVIDVYGSRFNVDRKLCEGKIKWKE